MNTHPETVAATVSDLELSHWDLRYQGQRLRQPRLEAQLLAHILAII